MCGMCKRVEATMGFVPSSMLTMAMVPGLLGTSAGLAGTISNLGQIGRGLTQMIANMASNAAGSRYCPAHTADHASHAGGRACRLRVRPFAGVRLGDWQTRYAVISWCADHASLRAASISSRYLTSVINSCAATYGLISSHGAWHSEMDISLRMSVRTHGLRPAVAVGQYCRAIA